MRKIIAVYLLAVYAMFPMQLTAAEFSTQTPNAAEGVIRGRVQKVGFRAFIFRQAIRYNLGGTIENLADGSVHFILQGAPRHLEEALEIIRHGPAKAGVNAVDIKPVSFRAGMLSVTVKGWTSATRDFQKPVDLVYPLREPDQPISEQDAHRIFKEIIRSAMASAKKQTKITEQY